MATRKTSKTASKPLPPMTQAELDEAAKNDAISDKILNSMGHNDMENKTPDSQDLNSDVLDQVIDNSADDIANSADNIPTESAPVAAVVATMKDTPEAKAERERIKKEVAAAAQRKIDDLSLQIADWSRTIAGDIQGQAQAIGTLSQHVFDFVKSMAGYAYAAGNKDWSKAAKPHRAELVSKCAEFNVGSGQVSQAFGLLACASGKKGKEKQADVRELVETETNLRDLQKAMTEREANRKLDPSDDKPATGADASEGNKDNLTLPEKIKAALNEALTHANGLDDDTVIKIIAQTIQDVNKHFDAVDAASLNQDAAD